MVNVDKKIKPAEKQAAPATVRRPRNQALNSSKTRKAPMSAKAHQKLNSSKKSGLTRSEFLKNLNCSTNGWDKYYNRMSSEQLADFYSVPVEDIIDWNNAIEQSGYGKVVEHLVAKPEYELDELDQLDVLDDGTVGYAIAERGGDGSGARFFGVDLDDIAARVGDKDESYDSSLGAAEDLNSSADASANDSAKNDIDLDGGCDSDKKDMNSELNCSASEVNLAPEWDKYYDITSDSKTAADRAGIDVASIVDWDNEIENSGYGTVVGYLSAKPEYVEFLDELSELNVLADGTVGYGISGGRGLRFYSVSIDEVENLINKGLDSSKSSINCSEESSEASNVKITTESGNEVSLSDIQIIQDPNTNEIALFIQEDPDEAIPEGFTVIGVASQPALPAVDGEGAVCPECGQDPCVCDSGENLDSSATPRQS